MLTEVKLHCFCSCKIFFLPFLNEFVIFIHVTTTAVETEQFTSSHHGISMVLPADDLVDKYIIICIRLFMQLWTKFLGDSTPQLKCPAKLKFKIQLIIIKVFLYNPRWFFSTNFTWVQISWYSQTQKVFDQQCDSDFVALFSKHIFVINWNYFCLFFWLVVERIHANASG